MPRVNSQLLKMTLRCTSCVNIMCDKKICRCGCHKIRYVQVGNGAVHYEKIKQI